MERQKAIATTILQQIKALDYWALGAYGARDFVYLPETKEFEGGVRFKVNGLHHKGTVKIMLNWADTYDIKFMTVKGIEVVTVKEVNDVYCDMLVDILDFIEKGE